MIGRVRRRGGQRTPPDPAPAAMTSANWPSPILRLIARYP